MSVRKTVKVPGELIDRVDRFIERSKGIFRSRPEVTIAALEKFLKKRKRGRKRRKS